MALNKIATTQLDTTAYYQKLLDLNVRFFVNDDNTAILEFPVTRNNNPVPLSEVNTKSYIAIITPDGSKKIDYLEFHDELNGVLRYKLPNDVLAHVGKHHAQVYISVKGVSDVVVERKISFHVEDDYINSIDSDTKLSYIRIFDDLYSAIQERVVAIEKAIENAADYVTQIENARDQAYEDITNLVNLTKQEIKQLVDSYKAEVKTVSENSINEMQTQSESYIQQAYNAKTEVTQAINEAELIKESRVRELISVLQSKDEAQAGYEAFLQQAKNYADSLITSDTGKAPLISGLDFNNFNATIQKSGEYYFNNSENAPKNVGEGFVRYIKYAIQTSDDTPEIINGYVEVIPKNNSQYVYVSWINSGVVAGWKKTFRIDLNEDLLTKNETNTLISNSKNEIIQTVNDAIFDTGWVPITLLNGVTEFAADTIPKVRLYKHKNVSFLAVKGAVKGVTGAMTIGKLPTSVAESVSIGYTYMQQTSDESGKAQFTKWAISTNGEIKTTGTTRTSYNSTLWLPIDTMMMI
ncbi:BppU family phage baseplate upper protein [Staphylococcus saprophyticus]|nr:BppU family phage baseplate upper protein [Staphylococcus saprophyticus]